MADDYGLAPADDAIAAIRVVRGVLDGESGPWEFPVTAVRGMALMLIGVLRANAELQGVTGSEAQDAYVRDYLDGAHQTITLLALSRGEGADG